MSLLQYIQDLTGVKQAQRHLIHMLQHAVASNSYETYKKYAQGIYDLPRINLRELLDFKKTISSNLQQIILNL